MPTAFTHGLVGGAFTAALPQGYPRWKVLLVFIPVAVLPDLDVITFKLGIPYSSLFGHRGFSHSLLFSLLVSLAACSAFLHKTKIFSKEWYRLFGLLFISSSSHGLLDAMTNGGLGVGLFIPFSQERIFFSLRPIRVSPVSPLSFFKSRSLGVLWSEIVWVWIPAISFVAVSLISRVLSRKLYLRDKVCAIALTALILFMAQPCAAADRRLFCLKNPANRPVFVHCRQGQDRTGIVVAAYRMRVDGWSLAEAEMQDYGFNDIWTELK